MANMILFSGVNGAVIDFIKDRRGKYYGRSNRRWYLFASSQVVSDNDFARIFFEISGFVFVCDGCFSLPLGKYSVCVG